MKSYRYQIQDMKPLDLMMHVAHKPYTLFFDSADSAHSENRFSFIAFSPQETLTAKNGVCSVVSKSGTDTFAESYPFSFVQQRLLEGGYTQETNDNLSDDLPAFQGGAAGYFGYDLARSLERLPKLAEDDLTMPDMAIGLYDRVYAWDHQDNTAWLFVLVHTKAKADKIHQDFLESYTEKLDAPAYEATPVRWRSSHTPSSYQDAVQNVIDYIYAGDIFQSNLSQRFEADLPLDFDVFAHYLHIREVNPAPFAAYMNFGKVKLVSTSPERFLSIRNRAVETRPIKGTMPRSPHKEVDAANRAKLEQSEKDKAENIMIVDLLRNDISKVCEDHSIDVPQLCELESFAKVHHLVSTVVGTLRADKTPLDLLKACFPGGSITGAPKIRAMEIIEELEDKRRGPYCGAMGYIGYHNTMDTNIIIRTLVYHNNRVSFNVGGGIVADSKPQQEYEETLSKAEGLFRSFDYDEEEQGLVLRREK